MTTLEKSELKTTQLETNQSEINQSETTQLETNKSEINQSETNQTETNQSETNQSETNQSETNQSETNQSETSELECNDENLYSPQCNKLLADLEVKEQEFLLKNPSSFNFLYPNLNDPKFNLKIASKKEFNENTYDGTLYDDIKVYSEQAMKATYDLAPHQLFVKNFLSLQTPYNSLLLYHGLGTGKTCSAIGVTEEMRAYNKQMGISKRIIIVASENVQNNFKLQLFDERRLIEENGIWNLTGCVGNNLIKEVNPMSMPISREKLIAQVKSLINSSYVFLGYIQFANYIIKTMNYEEEYKKQRANASNPKNFKFQLNKSLRKKLNSEFGSRLIVIDEIHNIRKSDVSETKKVALNLEYLVQSVPNMRLLFLSATPMYNSSKEIIWLLNLMAMNDKRSKLESRDVFDSYGNIKASGRDLLIAKSNGYVSFVRGENPYTFPYRIYPKLFAPQASFPQINYPNYQMNAKKIKHEDKKRIISLYLNTIGKCGNCGECQYCNYKYIISKLRASKFNITTKQGVIKELPNFENMESFGYTMLMIPLEALIISYPHDDLREIIQQLPKPLYSNDFSPSFSELKEKSEPEIDVISESSLKEASNSQLEEIDELQEEEQAQELSQLISSSPSSSSPSSSSPSSSSPSSSSPSSLYNIEPKYLTGKTGLERMMNFKDTRTPPIKGEFEYKQSILNSYGRLFTPENIGKYSAKIKTIIDNIYDPINSKVAEGLILIYSQFIDGGLIPMALALEELGVTRYNGAGAKSLFKTPPLPPVEVSSFQPLKGKGARATYSIICGDPRLSPNNDLEVKIITDETNKSGEKVKIVLISKSGSEGIDFKFIRQVHILEPWYNMNRLEQIIGRAIRNKALKDLPFEKRNVMIYLHGTILDTNEEEAVDLYVYRVAEHKAKQIGEVTRLLKENSVDCIINYEQTNFTQEKINELLKTPVKQELSNGLILDDFKIGDEPYSVNCDYMEFCEYNCTNGNKIPETDNSTYNEYFNSLNYSKIIEKVRLLFKQQFFYKKDTLIKLINIPREYPLLQIYGALSQLIDENEILVSKYGTNGRLINIGDYYLFQPLELISKNISLNEINTPLDYKHEMIKFEFKPRAKLIAEEQARPIKRLEQPTIISQEELETKQFEKEPLEQPQELQELRRDVHYLNGVAIMTNLKENSAIVNEFKNEPRVERGDDNYYKHAGIVIQKMGQMYPESKDYLIDYLIAHFVELLLFDDKLDLINYLYSINLDNLERNSLEAQTKRYFEYQIISLKNFNVLIMYKLNKLMIMILDENNKWVHAEPEDQLIIAKNPKIKEVLQFNKADYNQIIGFIGY